MTDLDVFMVTLHIVLSAESHPLQLSNVDPAAGAAVRVSAVPVPYEAVQVSYTGPQTSPGPLEVTSPRPVPALLTVSTGLLKATVIHLAAFIVTVQVEPETDSQPLHPVRAAPSRGVAVRVTTVPPS
jgi:hypothetical protein